MTNNEKRFRQKVEKLAKVYVAKNKDYGDSFSQSLDKYGIIASLVRMGDKMNRIDSLYDKPTTEVDESLVDSLEDLANYAIMTAIWLEKQAGDSEVDYTDSTFYVSDDPYFTVRKYSDGRTENITYFDDDDYEDDFDDDFDDLFDDDFDGDYDDDIERELDWNDDDHDAFLDMLSNLDSEDDDSDDDADDFIMDGLPKFRIVRRPRGTMGNKDFINYLDLIRYLFGTEGD